MKDYVSWPGSKGYSALSVLGRSLEKAPWILNAQTNQCELQCSNLFWADWNYYHTTNSHITNAELLILSKDPSDYVINFTEDSPSFVDFRVLGKNDKFVTQQIFWQLTIRPLLKQIEFGNGTLYLSDGARVNAQGLLDKVGGHGIQIDGKWSHGIFRCKVYEGEQGAIIQREEQCKACGSKSCEDEACVASTEISGLFG